MQDNEIVIPFRPGSELTTESFNLIQNDNTYMLAAPRYYQFYASYIRPRTAFYRGWIEGFHNSEIGLFPTLFLQKIGAGIISTLFGKPFVLNSKDPKTNEVTNKQYKKSNFYSAVLEAYGYALDGGTGLLKWNKDDTNQLRAEALPMDKFFVSADSYGDIVAVKSFLATYHNTIKSNEEYYLCEERFFRYATVGNVKTRFPMVHYLVYKTSSNSNNENTPTPSEAIKWSDIPYEVREMLKRDYGTSVMIDLADGGKLEKFDKCQLLPFNDDLGCRLIKFTRNIPAYPKMPFGQPLADLLLNESYQYDQLKFFEKIEVYTSRGRVMVEKSMINPNDPESRKHVLDPLVFTEYDGVPGESNNKPETVQPELRADGINRQKQNILNDAAFALNLSATTIASWLSDGQTQKTATEIEFERSKTGAFIDDKNSIIHDPLQEMIDLFYHYYETSAPELVIVSENQTVRSEAIRQYSELFDKGQVTAEMLAKEILGTSSLKEINELANHIKAERTKLEQQARMMPMPQAAVKG